MGLSELKREIDDISRLEHVLVILVKNEMGHIVEALNMKHLIPSHMRARKSSFEEKSIQPKVLRETFEELGGAFIKLAQFLSLRPDLIPKEYCEEFKKLQDRVKPFDGNKAFEIVKRELEGTNKKFSYFNKTPLASGSIAQVHEAVISNGKRVVIKVQRDDAEKVFRTDIDILKHAAKIMEERYGNGMFSMKGIVEEFERYTLNELDFLKEAKNIDRFYDNFKGYAKIRIPIVFWDFTTRKILTMEYMQGDNIETLKRRNVHESRKKKIVKEVSEIIFKQIFEHGFFHADPHPGNIFVMRDDTIVLLDFGIVGRIDEDVKEKLTDLFISLMGGDAEGVAESFLSLNIADRSKVNKARLKEDLRDLLGEYYNTPLNKLDIGVLFHNALDTAKKNNLHMPSDLVLLGKALVTVEGFCVELDPSYNLVKVCRPYIGNLKKKALDPKDLTKNTVSSLIKLKNFIRKIPDNTEKIVDGIEAADKSIDKIDEDIHHLNTNLNKSVNRISLVILSIGFLLASVFMIGFGAPIMFGIPLISLIGFLASALFLLLLFFHMLKDS